MNINPTPMGVNKLNGRQPVFFVLFQIILYFCTKLKYYMNKINEIKDTLKRYQTTPEYKKKGQFDLHFQGDDDHPIGIYEYKNDLFILTADGYDKSIEDFSQDVIDEIYKQVCKN